MKFLKIANYLFHPLWIPTFATFYFFLKSPSIYEPQIIGAKLLAVSVLTFFLPAVILLILHYLRYIKSFELSDVGERKFPLLIFTLIAAFIVRYVFNFNDFLALNLFFLGVFFSGIIMTLAALLNLKISLHTAGISGLLIFVSILSYYFLVPGILGLAFLLIALGWTFSARLASKAHTVFELFLGIFVGGLPQLLVFMYGYSM